MQEQFTNEKQRELHKKLHQDYYLTCEQYYIFELLTVAGGMMGLYTYMLRGAVFSNAQTGNIVKMSAAVGQGNFREAFYYLIPFTAYVLGTILSEILPQKVKRTKFIRWDTLLVGIEIAVLFLVGLMPLTWPDQIAQVIINFLCAMQFNTFRQAEGVPMATTFVTNHVRQIGISVVRIIKHHEQEAEARAKMAKHVKIIFAFSAGGTIVTALAPSMGQYTIWLAMIPLSACFCVMLQSDLVYEKAMLDVTPHGH